MKSTMGAKRAVILMNLGSPDSTEVKDVRKYLDEFLMDERVIDTPYLWRSILVKGFINPFRAPKSAEAYSSIWSDEGSPLVAITRQQQQALQQVIDEPIEIAMRYGNPNMQSAYDAVAKKHPDVEEVVLLPMYPHYAMSSFETAVEHAKAVHLKGKYKFATRFVPPFYNNESYISALTDSIRPHLDGSHLLFSYHSIPERHLHKGDPTGKHCLQSGNCCAVASPAHTNCYRHHCLETTRLVVKKLGLKEGEYSVAFQSKLGRSEWLKPATTLRMQQMPGEGIKELLVVCPSFVSDCLETLEEIAIRERENFMTAGGSKYNYVPCLNTQPTWIQTIAELVG